VCFEERFFSQEKNTLMIPVKFFVADGVCPPASLEQKLNQLNLRLISENTRPTAISGCFNCYNVEKDQFL